MTARAKVRQSDIERAVRSAKKAGARRVRVEPDGTIDIVLDDGHMLLQNPQRKTGEIEDEDEGYPGKVPL